MIQKRKHESRKNTFMYMKQLYYTKMKLHAILYASEISGQGPGFFYFFGISHGFRMKIFTDRV